MKEPRVYSYLNSLQQAEWEGLCMFMKSLYKEDSDIYVLLEYLFDRSDGLPSLDVIHEELFHKSSRKNVSNKLFILKEVIEDYFVKVKVQNNIDARKVLLIEALIDRGHYAEAEKKRAKIKQKLIEHSRYDLESTYLLHKLEHITYFSTFLKKFDKKNVIIEESVSHLKAYLALIQTQYEIEKEYTNGNENGASDSQIISKKGGGISLALDRLRHVLLTNNKESCNELIEQLTQWPKDQASENYGFILMHLILHLRKQVKKSKYVPDVSILRLYKLALKHNIYTYRGYINFIQFENMIDVACSFGATEWAQDVLDEYGNSIEPELRPCVRNIVLAHIFFYEKEYEDCLEYLWKSKLSNTFHMLRTKWLSIMCFYEMKRWDEAVTSLNAFSTYARNHREELSDIRYQSIMNFISLTRKLISNVAHAQLETLFKDTKHIVKGTWIQLKVKEKPLIVKAEA